MLPGQQWLGARRESVLGSILLVASSSSLLPSSLPRDHLRGGDTTGATTGAPNPVPSSPRGTSGDAPRPGPSQGVSRGLLSALAFAPHPSWPFSFWPGDFSRGGRRMSGGAGCARRGRAAGSPALGTRVGLIHGSGATWGCGSRLETTLWVHSVRLY